MCGLSAVFALGNESVDCESVKSLHAEIASRGPDGEGFFFDTNIALAHRRLAIIDRSPTADQPFFWQDRYVVIFNGEIYNYRELRSELESHGVQFSTVSDTEVLIAAYSCWGRDCLNRFNGMWAFVIWDLHKEVLFCSRDRFGIKPLYWAQRNQTLYLASELKQLCAIGLGSRANSNELSRFLYAGSVASTSSTFFDGINSLPAGHCLIVSSGQPLHIERWYQPSHCTVEPGMLPSLLADSVDLRLRSDVRVGSCLSGGLDSSALVMLASSAQAELDHESLRCLHARSSDLEFDESLYASFVADVAGANLQILTPSPDQFWQSVNEICRIQDEPFGSPSICMQYFVMQHARASGCTVMLDGQGADEVFLGYPKYLILALRYALSSSGLCHFLNTFNYIFSANPSLTPRSTLQYLFGAKCSRLRAARARLRIPFLNLSLKPVCDLYGSVASASTDCLRTQLLELFHTSLPALLRYEDRNSMAHSVEARLPYLDYRLVEAALALPVDHKIHNGWSKYPLRSSGILPDAIAWRRSKLGFNAPERTWIDTYSSQMLAQSLDSSLIATIADRGRLESSWSRLDRRERWRIFNVALWADIYKITS